MNYIMQFISKTNLVRGQSAAMTIFFLIQLKEFHLQDTNLPMRGLLSLPD